MLFTMEHWRHAFKLDPAKAITDAELAAICESGTDGVIIGGTDYVTLDGVFDLLTRVQQYDVSYMLEVSNLESIMPGFSGYLIPMVLNSKDKRWVMDLQHEAIMEFGYLIDWNTLFVEGYCVMNPKAKAFTYTNCTLPTRDEVVAYAQMAEHIFKLPIFYLEYSGIYGDPELVEVVRNQLDQTQLVYGGGIESAAQAAEMAAFADTIVVGNVIYKDLQAALKTVHAVKEFI